MDFRTRSTKVSARRALPFVLYCYVIAVTWKGTKCFGNTCEEYPLDNTISFAFIIFLVATKKMEPIALYIFFPYHSQVIIFF